MKIGSLISHLGYFHTILDSFCSGTKTIPDRASEKKNVTEILKAQKNLTSSITSGRPFLPVVDHKFLYGEFDSVINNCF